MSRSRRRSRPSARTHDDLYNTCLLSKSLFNNNDNNNNNNSKAQQQQVT